MRVAAFQQFIANIIKSKRKGPIIAFARTVLYTMSIPYRAAVAVRNFAYDKKLLKIHTSQACLVISVGNIVAGGAGKTPVTLMLGQELIKKAPLAILSRGYRSTSEKQSTFLSLGEGPILPPHVCGDEPFLLAHNLPEAFVVVGRDRCQSASMAVNAGAKILLLDDGMQHRKLKRHLDVVVVNAKDPFGGGHYLPRGFLRDTPRSLKRAHLIIINMAGEHDLTNLEQQIRKHTAAPIVGIEMDYSTTQPIENQKVGIFCGIANPENFVTAINSLGGQIVLERFFPNHFNYEYEHVHSFCQDCVHKGASLLLCTEKDWVKISHFKDLPLPVQMVSITPKIVFGHEEWKNWLGTMLAD